MKVLFVCLGNICRSPMAEGILRSKAAERGVSLEIDSCGTADYHVGESPDKRAVSCMKDNGIDISSLRGRQFGKEDFDNYDRIFVMDKENYKNVMDLAPTNEHKGKVDLYLNLSHPGENRVVPDPWFGGPEGFDHVYEMLSEAANAFLIEIND